MVTQTGCLYPCYNPMLKETETKIMNMITHTTQLNSFQYSMPISSQPVSNMNKQTDNFDR